MEQPHGAVRLRAGGDRLKTAKTNWAFVSVKCQSSGVANSVYKELVYKCAGFFWPTNAAFHLSQEESVVVFFFFLQNKL